MLSNLTVGKLIETLQKFNCNDEIWIDYGTSVFTPDEYSLVIERGGFANNVHIRIKNVNKN